MRTILPQTEGSHFQKLTGITGIHLYPPYFMAVIMKKGNARAEIKFVLAAAWLSHCTVHKVQISCEGLTVTKGDRKIEIQV